MYEIGSIIVPSALKHLYTYDDRHIYQNEMYLVVGTNTIQPENPIVELFNFPGVCYKDYENPQGMSQLEKFAEIVKKHSEEITIQNTKSYDLETYEKSKDRLVSALLNKYMRTAFIGTTKFVEMSEISHPKHTLQKLEEY